MSQSTLQSGFPEGPPSGPMQKAGLSSWAAAALRICGNWLQSLDRILRGETTRPQALRQQSLEIPVAGLTLLIVVLALMYGFCMGMFPGCRELDPSYRRWLACTVKIPALFFLTLCVTFPSLYVVNALVGSRLRLLAVLKLLIAALAVNLAVLASAGPIVAFFSFSTTNTQFMLLLNVLVFAISGLLGMKFLLQTLHRLSLIPPQQPTTTATEQPHTLQPEPIVLTEAADPTAPAAAPAEPQQFSSSYMTWREADERRRAEDPSALDALEGHVLGRHTKTVFWCWAIIFGVVGAQMAWVLRPYFGNSGEAFVWFAPRSSNFFEGVWHAVQQLMW